MATAVSQFEMAVWHQAIRNMHAGAVHGAFKPEDVEVVCDQMVAVDKAQDRSTVTPGQ